MLQLGKNYQLINRMFFRNALILLFIVFNGFCFSQNSSASNIRHQLQKAESNKECATQIYNSLKENQDSTPKMRIFKSSASAIMCLHVGPTKKLKYAKESTNEINAVITEHPNMLEARLLRFSIESRIPKFIGLSKHLNEDHNFIVKHFKKEELTDIPQPGWIKYYDALEESKKFSDSDLARFRAEMK